MSAKRITRLALLTAAALIIFVIEAQLPALAPIPGIKLGLANVITVWALFALSPADAAMILYARIFLGALFAGSAVSLIYSLAGGTLCFLISLVMRRFVTDKQIWAVSIVGAMAHNIGQLTAAALIMKSAAVFAYVPVLLISGILTGAFTGVIAQLIHGRLKDSKLME
jgi:heptaprenyl diphosphate synthase